MRRNGNKCSKFLHFTDQNGIPDIVYCIRCVMVCKISFTNWNAKIALLRASMVVSYYIKLFRTGADRHNGILMSLLLLVAETKTVKYNSWVKQICYTKKHNLILWKYLRKNFLLNLSLYIKNNVLSVIKVASFINNDLVLLA